MHVLSIIFFVISSSSDNFIIGLSYAAKKIKINSFINIFIALISCLGTFTAMAISRVFLGILSPNHANIFGSIILLFFGFYMLFTAFKEKLSKKEILDNEIIEEKSCGHESFGYDNFSNELSTNEFTIKEITSKEHSYNQILTHPEVVDKNNSKTIEFKEAIILGFILSINNFGLGIGASLSNLNIWVTSLGSLIFSVVFIKLGYYIGDKLSSRLLSNNTEMFSAGLIILLGIYELFI